MLAPLTPPPSPPALLPLEEEETPFEKDLAFVMNQERIPGRSFAYNLEFKDYYNEVSFLPPSTRFRRPMRFLR